jgi:glycosyltransferase involved in cell wall biosynthesis
MNRSEIPSAIVVHAGSRDNYQVATAMHENNALRLLVTNVFHEKIVKNKYNIQFDKSLVHVDIPALLAYIASRVKPSFKLNYFTGQRLGATARMLARKEEYAIFSCSYYAFTAFKPGPNLPKYRFLFQLHPHPNTVRKILLEEIERYPQAKVSLSQESEITRTQSQFQDLAQEPLLANGWVVASSFTAQSLIDNGVDKDRIHIAPYGLDRSLYIERENVRPGNEPFTIIFLGSLIQRKGLFYLLDAVRMLKTKKVRVVLRGRSLPDEELIRTYRDLNIDVALNSSNSQVISDLHNSDIFVLPSLIEGFGHSLLQAMGCGLPVIATPNTCAADIIENGKQGFIVPIRDPTAIAEKLDWSISNRNELNSMGREAARKSREYTWARFRSKVWDSYIRMCSSLDELNL